MVSGPGTRGSVPGGDRDCSGRSTNSCTTTIDDLQFQLYGLHLTTEQALDDLARYGGILPEERQAAHIAEWVEMLFALLRFLAQDDEEELERLASARRCFYQTMAWSEEAANARGGVMLVHWQRKLASCLASTLPDDMLDDVPLPVWEGPWMEEVKVS